MKGKNFGMDTAMVVMGMLSGISCSGKEEEWPSFAKMAGGFGLSLGDDSLDGAVDEEAGSAQEDGGEEELLVTRKVQEEYPLLADEAENRCFLNRDDYITLQDMQKEGHYQVKAGDTLWGIARNFYAAGSHWPILEQANSRQIADENLIFPGMELLIPSNFFIRRQSFSRGGFSSPSCSYDVPWDWVAGRPKWEICLEYSWYPEEGNYGVYTHVTKNRIFPRGAGDAWESIQQKIIEISEEKSTVSFSLPVFERYRRQDGRELLFYHFVATAGERDIQFAVAYVAGERYLAEFIGICPLTVPVEEDVRDIVGITRYMAASYREEAGEKEWDSLKSRPYLGEDGWLFEDLHNPFAIAQERFGEKEDPVLEGEDGEVHFVSGEWEMLLKKMICYHFDYSKEQREEFADRPIRLGELAWIEEVKLVESPIPGRDQIVIQGLCPPEEQGCAAYNLTTLSDLAALPNLQKLTLEIGTATDYEALAGCPSLRELSITGQEQIRDLSFLRALPKLESLTLNVSYIPHLLAMGVELEDGTTFSKEETPKDERAEEERADGGKAGKETIEEILGQCTGLTYLDLEYTQELDYGFLEKLPSLYTFILDGKEDGERKELFSQTDCPQVRCLVVDGSWLRNPA